MIGRLRRQSTDPALAAAGGRRMLVTVTVMGSAGPIRFVAGEEDPVAAVIGTALRCYACEGRFPALGCDVGEYHLVCARSDYMEPLDHGEAIGACGARDFTLCKKSMLQRATFEIEAPPPSCSGGRLKCTRIRCYAREGRFPALGCEVGDYHQISARSDYMEPVKRFLPRAALDHGEVIGAHGAGNFTLCKKMMQLATFEIEAPPPSSCSGGRLKVVPNASLPFFRGVPSAVP